MAVQALRDLAMHRRFSSVRFVCSMGLGLLAIATAAPTTQAESLRVSGSHTQISPTGQAEIYATEGHLPMPTEQDFNNGQLVLRVYSGLDPQGRGIELLNAESEQLGMVEAAPSPIPSLHGQLEMFQPSEIEALTGAIAPEASHLLNGLE